MRRLVVVILYLWPVFFHLGWPHPLTQSVQEDVFNSVASTQLIYGRVKCQIERLRWRASYVILEYVCHRLES